jgi:hypothetical protein
MRRRPELGEGLRRAYVLVLAPLALVAPLPLFWTAGASPMAVVVYESALLLLWLRARSGNPVRLSDAVLNVIGFCYLFWLAFEISTLRRGLLLSVSHLLLLTAIAKIASLKRPAEARTALLVLFLLTLASASSSTHVLSLLYFLVMAFLAFRALSRLAVLADFDDAPPDRVIASVPTAGLSAAAVVAALLLAAPLFYVLPRLRSPFAVAGIRVDDAFFTSLAADRVDLESFGAAKRSDRVVFRMDVEPLTALPNVLRLREAVFTDYREGVWTRSPFGRRVGRPGFDPADRAPQAPSGQSPSARLAIDLNLFANGFLFLPYGASGLELDRGFPVVLPDGVVRLTAGRRTVHYRVEASAAEPRGIGLSAIDPASVPPEIRDYAAKLTGDLSDPAAIYDRIRGHFAKDFVYTLDAPRGSGDPLVNFLLRSKSGHCEFFASGAAMMLTARGIPARLVTGSYGGEIGFLSRALVVRGGNLHAWVEADIDGRGFSVLDPTPPAGIPPATSRVSFWERVVTLGREIEFFYDRRILGFDSFDQVRAIETARVSVAAAAQALGSWKQWFSGETWKAWATAFGTLALSALMIAALRRLSTRAPVSVATGAYLTLRRLLARRLGSVSAATPPAEVARLFGQAAPAGQRDALAIVVIYCDSAFGGRPVDSKTIRELGQRVARLKKLA